MTWEIYVSPCCYTSLEIRGKNDYACENCGNKFKFENLEKI